MTKQLARVAPLKAAVIFAILYFVMALPFVAFMAIATFLSPPPPQAQGPSPFFLLAMPFLYAVLGFVLTLFGAWAYNFVAKRVGGIEFETNEKPQA